MKTVLVSWSGGKDSCLALYELLQSPEYTVAALLTTVTRDYDRVSMHGVRRATRCRPARCSPYRARQLSLPPLHETSTSSIEGFTRAPLLLAEDMEGASCPGLFLRQSNSCNTTVESTVARLPISEYAAGYQAMRDAMGKGKAKAKPAAKTRTPGKKIPV